MPVVRIEVSGENERGIRRKNGKNEVTGDLKENPTPSPPPSFLGRDGYHGNGETQRKNTKADDGKGIKDRKQRAWGLILITRGLTLK